MSKGGVSPVYTKQWPKEALNRVVSLRNKGLQPKEIADAMGIKQHAVYTMLKEIGQPASGRGSKLVDRINVRLDADCAELVRRYCARHNKSITMAMNELIRSVPKELIPDADRNFQ